MTAEADLGEGAVTMDALVIGWSFRSDNTEYTHIQFDNTDDKIGTTGTPPADVSRRRRRARLATTGRDAPKGEATRSRRLAGRGTIERGGHSSSRLVGPTGGGGRASHEWHERRAFAPSLRRCSCATGSSTTSHEVILHGVRSGSQLFLALPCLALKIVPATPY